MGSRTYAAASALARASAAAFAPPPGWPAFFALTDPDRTPDLLALAAALPPGAGLVLRHFGLADQIALARPLAAIARRRRLIFLIANDPRLASRVGADGVHWPDAKADQAARWAQRRPDWYMTASAHDRRAACNPLPGIGAVFASPVFKSASPSATIALGAARAAYWARTSARPVYALGGVHTDTLTQLSRAAFAGVCAVSAKRN